MMLALFVSAQCASGQRALTDEDRFTAFMFEQFRKAMPGMTIHMQAPLVLSVGSGKDAHTLDLHNVYRACAVNRAGCEAEVRSFISDITAFFAAPDPKLDRTMLRVVVRPQPYIDQMREIMARQGGPIVTPLVGDLWLVGVFDLPTTIKMANLRDVEPLGLSAEQALALAKDNMAASMRRGIETALATRRSGLMAVNAGPYETSLFGFPELWAPLAQRFHGNLLAALPAADTLLFGDGSNADMRSALAEAARSAMTSARRPFSDTVFLWTANGWKPAAETPRRNSAAGNSHSD